MFTTARKFSLYFFLILMVFLSASFIFIYRPLQVELRASLEKYFVVQAENSLVVLDTSIQDCIQNALTLSSHVAIRQKAYSFLTGEVSLQDLVSFTTPRWHEGVKALKGALYARRVVDGNLVASYGKEPESLPPVNSECKDSIVEYVRYDDRIGVSICNPVYGKDRFLGDDLVIFDASALMERMKKDNIMYRMIIDADPDYEKVVQQLDRIVPEEGPEEEMITFSQSVSGSGMVLKASIPGSELYSYSTVLARKFTLWFSVFTILLTLAVTLMVQKRNMDQIRIMKDLQDKVSENEERYRLLFDKGSDMILVHYLSGDDGEGKFVEANDIACQKLGYSRQELLQLVSDQILAPESRDVAAMIREKLLLHGKVLVEMTALAKNGRRIQGEVNAHIFNLKGKPTVLSIIRDITDRKAAEKTLKESERRYASIFNENEAVMLLVDPESGLIRDANPSACSFYEYSHKGLVGRRFSDIVSQNINIDPFSLLNLADTGTKKHFLVESVTSSGRSNNVEIYTTKLVFEEKKVLLLMVHDISTKVQAEDKVKKLNDELMAISTTDKLTGIKNRRHMEEILNWELDKARRYGDPVSLIMFDLDGFKPINDRYGHLRGDEVLKELARECSANLRSSDFFGRWGGDEFLIITPVPERGAVLLAEKMCMLIRSLNLGVTVSVGVAPFNAEEPRSSLLERADKAMYAAKSAGGDRVRSA